MIEMQNVYWLTNVRLETGYKFNNEVVTGTETALHHLLIQDGKIAKIVLADVPLQTEYEMKDAKELLVLPSFVENHFHLDKTRLGGPWEACTPVKILLRD